MLNSDANVFQETQDCIELQEKEHTPQLTVDELQHFFLEEENEQQNSALTQNRVEALSSVNSEISILDTASQSFKSSGAKRAKTHRCHFKDCDKLFTRPSLLKEHIQVKHLNIRKYKCDECGMAYTKKLHLQRHYLSSHAIDDKPFTCSFCEKKILTKQHLETHERTHIKPFKCEFNDQCDASFTTSKLLDAHIERAHLSKHEERLTCQFCKKKCQSPSKLRQHLLKDHSLVNEGSLISSSSTEFDRNLIILQNSLKQKKYQCSYHECDKSFNTWSMLQTHMKNDHPKVECLICKKKCVGEQGLQMHMMIHDESMSNKIWKCLICEEKFAKKLELIEHCKNIHDLDINKNKQYAIKVEKIDGEYDSSNTSMSKNEENLDQSIIIKKKVKKTDLELWKSNVKILNKIDNGDSMADVLLSSIGKKYECRIKNCYRKFKKIENYHTHLKKHKEYIEKLDSIKDGTANIKEIVKL